MINIFQSILTKIGIGIITVAITIGGFFGLAPKDDNLGATIPTVVALFSTTLASGITNTATSFTLTSGTTKDGTTLSGTYGFVIDEGTSLEEFVLATCANTVCTEATRGISAITGNTSVTALKSAHSRGANVKISDHPQLAIISRIVNGNETFPNLLNYASAGMSIAFNYSIPTRKYVDDTVNAGAADASLTIKGISEEATAAEINAGTQAGETSAQLFVNPSYLLSSNYASWLPASGQKDALAGYAGTPSSTNKYLTEDDRANYCLLTGDQTVAGIKTFSSFPVTPSSSPTTSYQVTNKSYVDTQVAVYTRLDFVDAISNVSTATNANIWEDWDISATCSAGALYAEIWMYGSSSNFVNTGVRANGNNVPRLVGLRQDTRTNITMTVKLDGNRIIERYTDGEGIYKSSFQVIGCWIQI